MHRCQLAGTRRRARVSELHITSYAIFVDASYRSLQRATLRDGSNYLRRRMHMPALTIQEESAKLLLMLERDRLHLILSNASPSLAAMPPTEGALLAKAAADAISTHQPPLPRRDID